MNNNSVEEKLDLYMGLVTSVVNRMNISIPSGYDKSDLVSYGLEGLHNAIKTFDNSKGSFEMYAKCKIKNQIIDCIRAVSPIPRSALDKKKKIQKAIATLEAEHNRCPTKEEIIEYLDIDEKKYKKYMESFNCGVEFSLNNILNNSNDEVEEFFTVKKDTMFDCIEKEELKQYLRAAIDGLNEKSRNVMFLRYYHDFTYKQIAAVLNISESTVGEIHNRTVVYLRNKIKQDGMF